MPTIPPSVQLEENTPTYPAPPDSESVVVSAYAYPTYFQLGEDDDVRTYEQDFVVAEQMTQDDLHAKTQGLLAEVQNKGEELLILVAYERSVENVAVPNRYCLTDLSGNQHCIDVPFQFCIGRSCIPLRGSTLRTAFQYRLWYVTRATSTQAPVRSRPLFGIVAALVVIIAVTLVLGTIVGLIAMKSGQLKGREILAFFKDVLHAPGENLEGPIGSVSWPFFALGIALMAGAIAFPMIQANVGANVPIGRATITAGAQAGRTGRP